MEASNAEGSYAPPKFLTLHGGRVPTKMPAACPQSPSPEVVADLLPASTPGDGRVLKEVQKSECGVLN